MRCGARVTTPGAFAKVEGCRFVWSMFILLSNLYSALAFLHALILTCHLQELYQDDSRALPVSFVARAGSMSRVEDNTFLNLLDLGFVQHILWWV